MNTLMLFIWLVGYPYLVLVAVMGFPLAYREITGTPFTLKRNVFLDAKTEQGHKVDGADVLYVRPLWKQRLYYWGFWLVAIILGIEWVKIVRLLT